MKEVIDFAVWYSGMERSKVERAYKKYLQETSDGGNRDNPFINAARGRDESGINEDEVSGNVYARLRKDKPTQ